MRRTTLLLSLLTCFCSQTATNNAPASQVSSQLLVSVTVSSHCQSQTMQMTPNPVPSANDQWSLSFSCPNDPPQQIRVGTRESSQIIHAPKHIKEQEYQAIVISRAIITAAQGRVADNNAPLILTIDY